MSADSWDVVAAVSAVFHQDPRYQSFYDEHGSILGGFPGIWGLCRDAGLSLHDAMSHIDPGGDVYSYIDTIDLFVDFIYHEEVVPIGTVVLGDLAETALDLNLFEEKAGETSTD